MNTPPEISAPSAAFGCSRSRSHFPVPHFIIAMHIATPYVQHHARRVGYDTRITWAPHAPVPAKPAETARGRDTEVAPRGLRVSCLVIRRFDDSADDLHHAGRRAPGRLTAQVPVPVPPARQFEG